METQETQITQDLRAIATKTIWSYATGMIALSMIFGPTAMKSGLLPLTIVAGAAGGTAAVWRSPDRQSQKKLSQGMAMKQLEQRVADLETIASAEGLDFEYRMKRLESQGEGNCNE
ncbi:MAG: hypothetical protein AB4352_26045 [Hormoscilla sp.]